MSALHRVSIELMSVCRPSRGQAHVSHVSQWPQRYHNGHVARVSQQHLHLVPPLDKLHVSRRNLCPAAGLKI